MGAPTDTVRLSQQLTATLYVGSDHCLWGAVDVVMYTHRYSNCVFSSSASATTCDEVNLRGELSLFGPFCGSSHCVCVVLLSV